MTNWQNAVTGIGQRKTVKFWTSELLLPEEVRNKGNLLKRKSSIQGGPSEVLMLFQSSPYAYTFPNNQKIPCQVLVYGITVNPENPTFPYGQMFSSTPIDRGDFNVEFFETVDITSTASGIFILTNTNILGFQYNAN
jgi:hypothetical protein